MAEDGLEAFLGLHLSYFRANQLQELVEVDGLSLGLQVLNDPVSEGALPRLAELVHDLVDLLRIDEAGVILIEEIEDVLELVVLLWHELFLPSGRLELGRGAGALGVGNNLLGATHIFNKYLIKQFSKGRRNMAKRKGKRKTLREGLCSSVFDLMRNALFYKAS